LEEVAIMKRVIQGLVILWAAAGVAEAQSDAKPVFEQAVERLGAKSALDSRIARAEVAHLGVKALPALERARAAKRVSESTLRLVVEAMLVESVELDVLKKRWPALLKLLDERVAKARQLAKPLFATKPHDSGERGLGPPGAKAPPLSAPRAAIAGLLKLGGAAVPVALELMAQGADAKVPVRKLRPGERRNQAEVAKDGVGVAQRLYGAEVLYRLRAWGQERSLEGLRGDGGRVSVFHGDYFDRTTVGRVVSAWMKGISMGTPKSPTKGAACLEAERYLRYVLPELDRSKGMKLMNRLRGEAKTWEATSFADYWRRARALIEAAIPK
jgi:hypothetical protein